MYVHVERLLFSNKPRGTNMKHHLSLFFSLCTLLCYGQEQYEPIEIVIDTTIIQEVEAQISPFDFGASSYDPLLLYQNVVRASYYESDSLVFDTRGQEQILPFKTLTFSRGDTVIMSGWYGLFGGFGFSIYWIDDQPYLYHMLSADEFPTYALTPDDPLELRIEVPCHDAKVIFSQKPEWKVGEVIYGMVQFSSGEYYQSEVIVDGEERYERLRIRMNMTIYFKSKYAIVPK